MWVDCGHAHLAELPTRPYDCIMYESILAELRSRWRDGNHFIGQDDIAKWSAADGRSATALFDLLAVELASDFFTGFLGWEFADGVANALWGALLEAIENIEWPETFNEFYLAFDHSERHGPTDRDLIRPFLQKRKCVIG
jgi:hypothetical protein